MQHVTLALPERGAGSGLSLDGASDMEGLIGAGITWPTAALRALSALPMSPLKLRSNASRPVSAIADYEAEERVCLPGEALMTPERRPSAGAVPHDQLHLALDPWSGEPAGNGLGPRRVDQARRSSHTTSKLAFVLAT